MKKYLALYFAPIETYDKMMQMPKEEADKGMAAWGEWMEKHKAEIVDIGTPLGKTKKVTKDGVTDVRNMIGGYTIVQANSADEAAAVFSDSPNNAQMEGGWIEVMECVQIPGM